MNDKKDQVDAVRLVNERIGPVKQLAGFEKHYRVPTKCSDGDHRYLAEIAKRELDADLQDIFSELRIRYGLKRKEISVYGPADGGGVIKTPFFNYEIHLGQREDDPSEIMWRRSITEISEPARVFAGPFEQIFGKRFSVLEISTVEPLDLESIVDHVEDAELDAVKIDYDKDLTWCKFDLTVSTTSVALRDHSIRVISHREITPQALLEAFLKIKHQFMATLNLTGVPFLADAPEN